MTPTDAAPDPTWTADYGYGLDGEGMALPQDWVRSRSAQIEPPESFTIDVFAAGHRSARRTFERKGRSIVDLGEIALARSARSIVVADPDFTPGRSVGSAALSFADRPEVEWGIRHAFYARDDKREIELDWRGEEALVGWHDLLSGETDARAFTRELGELVLLASDGEAYALRLGAQSEYRILPRHVCALEIDCERLSASGTWTLGWRGGGTWARFRAVNAVRRTSERLALPELATELWWSAGEAPPDLCKQPGGSLALDGTAQTIVLR